MIWDFFYSPFLAVPVLKDAIKQSTKLHTERKDPLKDYGNIAVQSEPDDSDHDQMCRIVKIEKPFHPFELPAFAVIL